MIPGRPTMMRVVTGRVQEQNNDVAIAYLNPLPQQHMNFDDIRGTLENFLQVEDMIQIEDLLGFDDNNLSLQQNINIGMV